jgi:hypothetical protein
MLDTTIANVFNENAWPCGFATKAQTTKTNGLKAPSHLLIDGAATGAAVAVTCRKCEGAFSPFVSVVLRPGFGDSSAFRVDLVTCGIP